MSAEAAAAGSQGEWVSMEVDLTSFKGKNILIAFRKVDNMGYFLGG